MTQTEQDCLGCVPGVEIEAGLASSELLGLGEKRPVVNRAIELNWNVAKSLQRAARNLLNQVEL